MFAQNSLLLYLYQMRSILEEENIHEKCTSDACFYLITQKYKKKDFSRNFYYVSHMFSCYWCCWFFLRMLKHCRSTFRTIVKVSFIQNENDCVFKFFNFIKWNEIELGIRLLIYFKTTNAESTMWNENLK